MQNWVDIDKDDAANPQACVEYVNEIYDHFFATEGKSGPSANYIARQADINEKMRAILVDWLVEVHLKFRLKTETLSYWWVGGRVIAPVNFGFLPWPFLMEGRDA